MIANKSKGRKDRKKKKKIGIDCLPCMICMEVWNNKIDTLTKKNKIRKFEL